MRRFFLGSAVVLHALAHANFILFAATAGPPWVIEPLWSIAILGYLAAGLGMFRIPWLRDRWKQCLVAGTVASILLLLTTRALLGAAGVVLDIALLVLVLEWGQVRVDEEVKVAELVGAEGLGHPALHRAAWGFGLAIFAYAVVVVAARPVTMRWGTSVAERAASLPGDHALPTGAATPTLAGIVLGPLNVFVLEPAHFIMERGMMRGVRTRAERMVGQPVRVGSR